jgi:DNA-3-methyladenine glycosylase
VNPWPGDVLPRSFYARDPRRVARDLLNKVLVHDGRAARLVEVEAYLGAIDPGAHSYRGMTRRNATMFGPAGHLYVYFTYGMHWCANAVCGDEGVGVAVLLRAGAPLAGLERMRAARPKARTDRDLCRGPARLCQAMGLGRDHDGADLVTGDLGVVVVDDGIKPPRRPANTTRVGLSAGGEHPWRWYVPGDPNVSGRLAAFSTQKGSEADP